MMAYCFALFIGGYFIRHINFVSLKLNIMPGRDQEYQYQQGRTEANKASRQSSENNRTNGLKDVSQTHGEIMQKENMKNKGSNKNHRDRKVGTDPGPKK